MRVLLHSRIINGVKEMCGFRMTFNLSYDSSGNESSCTEASCSEDISESTILVSGGTGDLCCNVTGSAGADSVSVLTGMLGRSAGGWR